MSLWHHLFTSEFSQKFLRLTTLLQSSSNSLTFLWFFEVFLTEASTFTKPPEVYRQSYVYSWVNICSPSCACQLYLTVLGFCLFCDYRNCGSTSQTSHNFPDFSVTNVKFPDFSRLSRWVATLIADWIKSLSTTVLRQFEEVVTSLVHFWVEPKVPHPGGHSPVLIKFPDFPWLFQVFQVFQVTDIGRSGFCRSSTMLLYYSDHQFITTCAVMVPCTDTDWDTAAVAAAFHPQLHDCVFIESRCSLIIPVLRELLTSIFSVHHNTTIRIKSYPKLGPNWVDSLPCLSI